MAAHSLRLAPAGSRFVVEELPSENVRLCPPGVGYLPMDPPAQVTPVVGGFTPDDLGYAGWDELEFDAEGGDDVTDAPVEGTSAPTFERESDADAPPPAALRRSHPVPVRLVSLRDVEAERALLCAMASFPRDALATVPAGCTPEAADAACDLLCRFAAFAPSAVLCCAWHAPGSNRRAAILSKIAAALAVHASSGAPAPPAASPGWAQLGDAFGRSSGSCSPAGATPAGVWQALRGLIEHHDDISCRLAIAAFDATAACSAVAPPWLCDVAERDAPEMLRRAVARGDLSQGVAIATRLMQPPPVLRRTSPAGSCVPGAVAVLIDALRAQGKISKVAQVTEVLRIHTQRTVEDSGRLRQGVAVL